MAQIRGEPLAEQIEGVMSQLDADDTHDDLFLTASYLSQLTNEELKTLATDIKEIRHPSQ